MGFEQIPNIDKRRRELDKEHAELDNKEYTTPDDIEEKKKIEEEHQKLSDQVKEIEKGKDIKENDEKRRELDEKHERLTNKDFKTPEDIEEIAKIEKKHEQLSKQSKVIDEKGGKKEEGMTLEDLEESISKAENFEDLIKVIEKSDGIQGSRDFWSTEELKTYIDDARMGMDIINITRTGGLRKRVGELIEEEKKSKIEEETKEEKKEKSKDDIKKKVEKEKAKKRKGAKAKDMEWKKTKISKEEADKVLKGTKEKSKKETGGKEKKGKKDLEKMGVLSTMEKILQDPEALSKIFHEAFEISKNPEVQGKFQELKDVVKKIIEEKKEAGASVKNAKDFIKKEIENKEEDGKEKKESPWGTIFGTVGWSILLFLVLFMLAELKGIDYFSGQAAGKKKEKK